MTEEGCEEAGKVCMEWAGMERTGFADRRKKPPSLSATHLPGLRSGQDKCSSGKAIFLL